MFTLPPPKTFSKHSDDLIVNLHTQGARVVIWQRVGEGLPSDRILLRNGCLLLKTFFLTMLDPTLLSREILIAL